LYFADDKDLLDLLSTAKHRLTVAKLVEMARSRGLCLSAENPRGALIAEIARLPHGWHELVALLEATDSNERPEKLSSCKLDGVFTVKDIYDAAEMVRDDRVEKNGGEVYNIEHFDKLVRVRVKYSDLDASKTRLVQRSQREFVVEFEKVDGGFRVRHEAQERAHDVLGAIEDVLLKATPGTSTAKRVNVELGAIRKPEQRTEFFLKLIKGLTGFTLEDVKGVRGSRLSSSREDEGAEQSEADEHGSDDGEEIDAEEATFVAEVKRIALQGDGILNSAQYKNLVEDAFFVSSIVWTSIENSPTGVRAEFDASFSNPEEGTGFTYAVRKVWERGTTGDLKKGKMPPAKVREDKRLVRVLEEAAHAAMTDVVSASLAPPASAGGKSGSEP
jgi:hypothetical protein